MRRTVSLLLALALAFSLIPSALAISVIGGGGVTISGYSDVGQTIVSIAAVDSTLYLLYDNGKVVSRPAASDTPAELGQVVCTAYTAEPEFARQEDGGPAFDRLFAMDGQPYALCTATGEVYRLLDDQAMFAPEKLPVTLDTSLLIEKNDEYSTLLELNSCFAQDGWLYFAGTSYQESVKVRAGRVSLETGAAQAFATPNITELAPYQDGRVLALLYDSSAIYGGAVSEDALAVAAQYAVFDPEKDVVETSADIQTDNTLGGYAISGLCYGKDSLFYRDGSRVMGLDLATGETRVSAYTGEGMYGGSVSGTETMYADGYYVYFNFSGLSVFQLDSEYLKNGALTIFGEFGSEAHKAFVKNHPEIPVDVSGEYTNDIEKLTQAMVSENQTFDVLMLSMGYMPVERLQAKGYCADLSAYPGIMERVNQMYPQYKDAITMDGKLYGVPVQMSGIVYGVNMDRWKELGLTEEDLPKSLIDLYDFAANWAYDYGEDNPDLALFDYQDAGNILFSLMLSHYMAYTQKQGEGMRFNTEVFQKLLDAFSAIDFNEIKSLGDSDENAYWNPESLFSVSVTVGYLNQGFQDVRPLYLSLTNEDEPFIAASVSVLIVNPKTKRMDQALLYLENYLDHLDPASANITLFPNHNDPVENDFYEQNKKAVQEELDAARERLEKAEAENKAAVREEISQWEKNLEEAENYRYEVSAEAISDYRENVAPLIYVQRQNVLYNADSTAATEINKLLMQFLEGAIDGRQLVEELDKRVRLMELEDM